jgi:hypothetical protein
MKNYLHKKLHPISMAIGRLDKFLLLKIPNGNMKAGRFQILLKNEKICFLIFLISLVVYFSF